MDHIQVQRLLSEAFDGVEVDSAALAEALEHAGSCTECSGFQKALEALGDTSHLSAPEDLVRDTLARAREEWTQVGQQSAVTLPLPAKTAQSRRLAPRLWPHFAIVASAAAVVVIAVAVSADIFLVNMSMDTTEKDGVQQESSAVLTDPQTEMGDQDENVSTPGLAAEEVPVIADDWLSYDGFAYLVTGSRQIDHSDISTIGSSVTALADPYATPTEHAVYTWDTSSDTLLLSTEESGTYLGLLLVSRTYEGRRYGLVAGAELMRFGQWPELSREFPPPVRDSGSPTFIAGGIDSQDVQVYLRPGEDAAFGIAIAPGTDPTDPAASNPNWTWWTPLED